MVATSGLRASNCICVDSAGGVINSIILHGFEFWQENQHNGQHDPDAGGVQQQPGAAGHGEDGGTGPGEAEDWPAALQHAPTVMTINQFNYLSLRTYFENIWISLSSSMYSLYLSSNIHTPHTLYVYTDFLSIQFSTSDGLVKL